MRGLVRYFLWFALAFAGCDANGLGDAHRGRTDAGDRSDAGAGSAAPDADVPDGRPAPDAADASTSKDAAVDGHGGTLDAGPSHGQPADPCGVNHGGCDPLVKCTVVSARAICAPCPLHYLDKNGNGTACEKIDACKVDNGGCEQQCESRDAVAVCACNDSYDLGIDGHSCLRWNDAQQVFAGKDIENPEVAIDDAGIAFMVWTKAPLLEAWVTRYTPGGGWGTATLIGSGNIVSDWARIAVSTSGNAMVLWNASDNRPPRCSYYTVGKGWSPSMVVGSADGDTRSGALSLDDQGNALVAWEQAQSGSPTDHAIWANRYAPDTGWDMAAPIETAGSYAVMPLVAFDRHGNAAVVWAEDGESYSGVLANRYSVGVGWGTEALIGASKPPERQAIEPDVAMGGKGNIVVVWYQGDAGYQRVFANRYTAANGWETPTPISPAGMFDSHHPKVTVSTAGDAIAVWVQTSSDLSHSEIWSNRYEVGSGWGAATAIGSDAGDQSWVDVAGDAEGNALAIWNDGGQFRLERYTSAQGWNEPISLGPSGAIYPGLAVSPAGHAIAIWATGNLEKYTLWARRFELGEASH